MALEAPAGSGAPPLLRFAAAYGFRNIQSLMRKIKAGKCEYDYVEVGGRGREGRQYEGQVNLQPSSGDHSPVAAVPLCLVRDLTLGPNYSLTGPCACNIVCVPALPDLNLTLPVPPCTADHGLPLGLTLSSPLLLCRSWPAPRAASMVAASSSRVKARPRRSSWNSWSRLTGTRCGGEGARQQVHTPYGHQVCGGRGMPAGPHPLGHQ